MNMSLGDPSSNFYFISFLETHFELFLFIVAFFSLFIGSFLNVVIYRLPRMMQDAWQEECRLYLGLKPDSPQLKPLSLALPFSHCPNCKKTLKPWHNIPLLSYLFLKGHCAYCQASISLRYPGVELLTMLSSVYLGWHFGLSWNLLAALIFTWILIALTFIDLDFCLLPDELTLLLLWLGLFCSLYGLFNDSHEAIIGAMAGYLIFFCIEGLFKKVTGKTGMGQGDLKLLAALGAFLGWQQLPFIILTASLIGALFGLSFMLFKNHFKSLPLPFGPYLALAGWLSLIWGNNILSIYWQWILG
ncbi:MAG TPA: prepilin peptidase [Gammaproteobacteria bacterium]|nr:prepilin peptidase [Gammaproteobacteria bacterium]